MKSFNDEQISALWLASCHACPLTKLPIFVTTGRWLCSLCPQPNHAPWQQQSITQLTRNESDDVSLGQASRVGQASRDHQGVIQG